MRAGVLIALIGISSLFTITSYHTSVMKTKIPLICLLLPCLSLPAAVLTVDNNSGSVAMYTSTTTAYNDAVDGDTILIAGSPLRLQRGKLLQAAHVHRSGLVPSK